MTAPDPLSVICPLCGALPTEDCEFRYFDLPGGIHNARVREARRVQAVNAKPTKPVDTFDPRDVAALGGDPSL